MSDGGDKAEIRLLQAGFCRHPEAVVLRGASWRPAVFPAMVGLIRHPKAGWLLFDTGYASHFHTATQAFPERLYRWTTPVSCGPGDDARSQLATLGIAAEDIRHIFISHFHGDHIAGLRDFPNARFYCDRNGLMAIIGASRWGGVIRGMLPRLLPPDFIQRVCFTDSLPQAPLPQAMQPFTQGYDLFGDGVCLAIPLPGHAAGQSGLLHRGADGRLTLLAADACWTLRSLLERRYPHPVTRLILDDPVLYRRSLDGLADLQQRGGVTIVPSHCLESLQKFGNG